MLEHLNKGNSPLKQGQSNTITLKRGVICICKEQLFKWKHFQPGVVTIIGNLSKLKQHLEPERSSFVHP